MNLHFLRIGQSDRLIHVGSDGYKHTNDGSLWKVISASMRFGVPAHEPATYVWSATRTRNYWLARTPDVLDFIEAYRRYCDALSAGERQSRLFRCSILDDDARLDYPTLTVRDCDADYWLRRFTSLLRPANLTTDNPDDQAVLNGAALEVPVNV
jgi:hypothetical protein